MSESCVMFPTLCPLNLQKQLTLLAFSFLVLLFLFIFLPPDLILVLVGVLKEKVPVLPLLVKEGHLFLTFCSVYGSILGTVCKYTHYQHRLPWGAYSLVLGANQVTQLTPHPSSMRKNCPESIRKEFSRLASRYFLKGSSFGDFTLDYLT